MAHSQVSVKSLTWKAIAGLVVITLSPAVILFGAAGHTEWWEAWVMVGMLALTTIASRVLLLRKHPDLAAERARWTADQGAKSWDKTLMPIVALYGPFSMWLVAGLDKRWNGSPQLPLALELAAFAVVIAGYMISTWALLENRFFSAVVRIQSDRGHTVITGGPYQYVRHPGYAGGALGYLAIPIALGTLWVFLPVMLTLGALVARTALEDQALQSELPGYVEYTRKTRYRLLPGVW